MFTQYVLQMVGPIGRWLLGEYTAYSTLIAPLLFVWIVFVAVGQHGVNKLRWQVRNWLSSTEGASTMDAGELVRLLEPRWQQAVQRVRWMPAAKGFWTRRATETGLRSEVGFTPPGLDKMRKALRVNRRRRQPVQAAR